MRSLSVASFVRASIPFPRASPSWLNHPQRPRLLIPSSWGLGFQRMNFEGHKHSDCSRGEGGKDECRWMEIGKEGRREERWRRVWETWQLGICNVCLKNSKEYSVTGRKWAKERVRAAEDREVSGDQLKWGFASIMSILNDMRYYWRVLLGGVTWVLNDDSDMIRE